MNACDICTRPGRCCTGFRLGGGNFGRDLTALEVLVKLATAYPPWTYDIDSPADAGQPFIPLRRNARGTWTFWCPVLVDGRCSDYENRPGLCRMYMPYEDALCAMHANSLTNSMRPQLLLEDKTNDLPT